VRCWWGPSKTEHENATTRVVLRFRLLDAGETLESGGEVAGGDSGGPQSITLKFATRDATFGMRCVSGHQNLGGEFDPGSGSTLAACLMHASRTGCASARLRGGRVRNTWATCPGAGGSPRKRGVIPHTLTGRRPGEERTLRRSPQEGAAAD
jgi:hypothetical protein